MTFIDNVSENLLLNQFNWNVLSCHDKALCVAAESIKKNAALFFILFKIAGRDFLRRHYDMGIGDAKYYSYIGEMCGLNLQRHYGHKEDFIDELKRLADSQEHCVLMINTKYQRGARLEGKKDHPHFMAYQGYDGDDFYFIDEDWTKQYWKTKDVDEVIYCQRKISKDELIMLGTNVDTCNIFGNEDIVPQDKYFMYYLLTKTNEQSCELDEIRELFKKELTYLVQHNIELMDYAKREMDMFSQKLTEYREKMVLNVRERLDEKEREEDEKAMKEQIAKARTDELFAVRTRFIYPCESEILGAYQDFLYMIKRMLTLCVSDFGTKDKITSQIQMVIGSFEYVKMAIARSVILGQNDLAKDAWSRYIQLNKKCMVIYKSLLREDWSFNNYE